MKRLLFLSLVIAGFANTAAAQVQQKKPTRSTAKTPKDNQRMIALKKQANANAANPTSAETKSIFINRANRD